MKKNVFIILAGLAFFNTVLRAQTTDILVVQGVVTPKGLEVNWHPTRPDAWKAQLAGGYRVTRTETDASGNGIGAATPIAASVLPKDAVWFDANKGLRDGLMEPIGALLYDTTFQFEPTADLNETDMKYNYIVFESTRSIEVASAVGLGLVDGSAQKGKTYRYDIQALGSTLRGSVVIPFSDGAFAQNPEDIAMDFTFPEGRSLSDMQAMANPNPIAMVAGLGRAYGDSIVLRWGPTTPGLWLQAITDGYEVYRAEGDGEPRLLKTVMPWAAKDITPAIAQDTLAMVAASILLKKGHVPESPDLTPYDRAAIFENYFSFALLAAERSPLAADILGLRFVDKAVKPGAVYTYDIRTKGLSNPLLWGYVTIENTFEPLAQPLGVRAEPQEQAVKLVWSKAGNDEQYSAYTVERSLDGVDYTMLTDAPLIFAESPQMPISEYSYLDRVGNNDTTYYYRLRGLGSFGEWSLPADVFGQGADLTPPEAVSITEAAYNDTLKQFVVRWEDTLAPAADLFYYQVLLAETYDGEYNAVSPQLAGSAREFVLDATGMDTDRLFFFKVESADSSLNLNQSTHKMLPVPDYTNPEPPAVLKGYIDSTGYVKVVWEPSVSKDAVGYWLYWANDPEDEFSLVDGQMITDNFYGWQVEAVSLTKKIYFCVRTEDDALNRSAPSEVIEVKRPDKVPPAKPYVISADARAGQIEISWKPSSSDDVAGQLLYRRKVSATDTLWQLLDTLPQGQDRYTDANVEIDQEYLYGLKVYDDVPNVSELSNYQKGMVPFPNDAVVVRNLRVAEKGGRHVLAWEYAPLNKQIANTPHTIELYRSSGGDDVVLLATAPSGTDTFSDENVQKNVLYNYAVRLRFDNGWVGDLSEVKSILVQ